MPCSGSSECAVETETVALTEQATKLTNALVNHKVINRNSPLSADSFYEVSFYEVRSHRALTISKSTV